MTMNTMLKALLASAGLALAATTAGAATLVNLGDAPVTIVVTEDGQKNEVTAGPAETVQFCVAGCFVTLPNGERQALAGTETLEITGADVLIK
jgi:predicted porin